MFEGDIEVFEDGFLLEGCIPFEVWGKSGIESVT